MTETQQIKIGDFGTSIIAFDKTSTKWGTLEYMSPEMRNGKGHSFETDVWSAGCVMYELVTLEKPFKGKGLYEIFGEINKPDIVPRIAPADHKFNPILDRYA